MSSPEDTARTEGVVRTESLLWLWFGFLGPPLVWAVRFAAAYALVPHVCQRGAVSILNVLTVASLLLVGVMGIVAWRHWRSTRNGTSGNGDTSAPRPQRFLALAGILASLLFFGVIVAEGAAVLLVDPCQSAGSPSSWSSSR